MSSKEIRQKFLDFFKERGHTIVPSSSLVPDDPSVLLTTAGMQQFKPYYSELDPETTVHPSIGKPVGKNAASIQKSFRTSDIDEVGDESHLTFFEMLGNFSFGGYFKDKSIEYGYEFITSKDWMGLEIDKVTVFDLAKVSANDWRKGVPFDQESYDLWKKYLPEEKIECEGVDNFWGPTGSEGPCGPTTEVYVRTKNNQSVEVWNIVFNQYYCDKNKKLTPLKTPGVDTGMGLERLAMVSQDVPTIFETDLFEPIFEILPPDMSIREKRIIADHVRGVVFLLAEGIRPTNKDRGYILRKLVRRIVTYVYLAQRKNLGATFAKLFKKIYEIYNPSYPELTQELTLSVGVHEFNDVKDRRHEIERRLPYGVLLFEFDSESLRFQRTLESGLKKLAKIDKIDAKLAFKLYESSGLPFEIIKELGGEKAAELKREDFDEEFKKHQEISRAGQEKKFGGHGLILDTGELKAGSEEELDKVLRLHTATHLLQAALREVLGPEVRQMGSDITPERTRFDFSFPRKMTNEEKKKVEDLVNQKVKEDLPVGFVELPREEAEKVGALYFFREKYPGKVKVYFVGKDLESAWSKEFCGGPHVKKTGDIEGFRIAKEESVAAGTRRIRGVLT